jgi:hypothetical protein
MRKTVVNFLFEFLGRIPPIDISVRVLFEINLSPEIREVTVVFEDCDHCLWSIPDCRVWQTFSLEKLLDECLCSRQHTQDTSCVVILRWLVEKPQIAKLQRQPWIRQKAAEIDFAEVIPFVHSLDEFFERLVDPSFRPLSVQVASVSLARAQIWRFVPV